MANFVQIYKSTDANAPVLTGQASKLVDLLDAVLVNGYTTAAVTSMTRASSTVTVTMTATNSTLVTGDYIKISGAVETDYNGVWQITVVSGTVFTFNIGVLTPTTPATGTILYRKAPLNWTKPYTGTNAAVFRSQNTASPRHYLQIIDNSATAGGAKEAQAYAYETMSANDTGTGRFPTTAQASNGLCWFKSNTADSTARAWCIIGDDKTFYLQINSAGSHVTSNLFGFGWFPSYKPADAYNTFIGGSPTFNTSQPAVTGMNAGGGWPSYTATSGWGLYLARSYSQTGSCIEAQPTPVMGSQRVPWSGTGVSSTYPDPVASGAIVTPVAILESGISGPPIRGRLPGFYPPFHSATTFNQYDELSNIAGLSGAIVVALQVSCNEIAGLTGVDRVGPWT